MIDKALLKKYNVRAPRYTSYPPATQFNSNFSKKDYLWHVENSNEDPMPKALSLYIHVPFCGALCYYCGCHKFISPKTSTVINYLANIQNEIKKQARLFNKDRPVNQIHFGGGTPTYLSVDQIETLLSTIKDNFIFSTSDDFELAIEIDPRTTSNENITQLANLGFNRMSFGIQDFDPLVQAAINRIQPQERC